LLVDALLLAQKSVRADALPEVKMELLKSYVAKPRDDYILTTRALVQEGLLLKYCSPISIFKQGS
jgi:hypothetical protein